MTRTLALLTAAALLAAGCRSKPQATAGMSAAEHAQMPAADTATASDRVPVRLSAEQAGAIGVTYTTVERGPLARALSTVGEVRPAEPNIAEVTTRVDGFVDRMYVDATGVTVRRGQPLLAIYSPMLVSAQQELLTAHRLAAGTDSTDVEAWRSAQALVAAARRRLAYWEISGEQIARLEQSGEVTKTLTLGAPLDGVVLEKMVVQGQSVTAGMKLYRLADLSTVWIEGEVFERDLELVRVGAPVQVTVTAYPGRTFDGRIAFVSPVVDEQSRAGRVRVAVPNAGGLLKPGMYASLVLEASLGRDLLSLPAEAIVMTGQRNLVFVVVAGGALEPREVTLGARAGNRIVIQDGVRAGERVVASANFLVDAESRLMVGGGMPGMPGMEKQP
jgi:Cu(I)/Ag(I) efflux system membrane fusion protein